MDNVKKQNIASWAQAAIATCGPMRVEDTLAGFALTFTGEPTTVTFGEEGLTKIAVETEGHFQMLLAALMYERAQNLNRAAGALMQQSRNVKE